MKLLTQPVLVPLQGRFTPPGDKSVSHRALILGSLATGQTVISGLLDAEDVKATAEACRQLGAQINESGELFVVEGTGEAGLQAPQRSLDMGNSGTAMRLLTGVLSAQPFDSTLVGDASLSRRPMRRIVEPLTRMGARIETTPAGTAPLIIRGNPQMKGIEYHVPVASAQVKSCLMLAGLYASGQTCITEPEQSRDHTEKMLPAFGVAVEDPCCVSGGSKLVGTRIEVPSDISSAAFFMAAAAMVPDSDVRLHNVGLNPTRDGILRVLQAMEADIEVTRRRQSGEEWVADIRIRYSPAIRAIDIPESWVPSLIDELPVIMALAATIDGKTRIRGAAELRVKESDRLAVMARGLETLGVRLREYEDGIDIEGGAIGGGEVDGAGDHRCAMSFAILGQVADQSVTVHGAGHINTSYPGFVGHLSDLGGRVEVVHNAAASSTSGDD